MLAVNVQESTTTTGTGSITLSGSSEDGRTFASQFQTDEKFTYYIDDRAGNFESGVGYLSGSTTLVREHVEKSSNGDALVNFGAGTKQVFIGAPLSGESDYPSAILSSGFNTSGRYILSSHWPGSYSSGHINATNKLYITPYINQTCVPFTRWAARVKTSAVGGVARIGLYQIDPSTGRPTSTPFMESDDIDCSSVTNSIDLSFSNNTVNAIASKVLPKAFFIGIAFNDASIRLQGKSAGNSLWMLPGNNATLTGLTYNFTMGAPTPTVAVLPDLTSASLFNEYGAMPVVGFNND